MSIKRKEFIPLSQQPDVPKKIDAIEKDFVTKEYISAKDIKKYAADFAKNISNVIFSTQSPQEQVNILLYFFNARDLLSDLQKYGYRINWLYTSNGGQNTFHSAIIRWTDKKEQREEILTIAELESFLFPIRQAILEEIKNTFQETSVYLAAQQLIAGDDKILELHDGFILKHSLDFDRNYRNESREAKEDRLQAMSTLFSLPQRSPYLAYHILDMDFITDPHEGMEIQKKLSITTLADILNTPETHSFLQTLNYLTQAIQGAAFLLDHHLRLTDLAPNNIAIDLETNRGMLFDYDSLHSQKYSLDAYIGRRGYFPPERIPKMEDFLHDPSNTMMHPFFRKEIPPIKGPITEAEMVYEFGVSLKKCRETYREQSKRLTDLQTRMLDDHPSNRPTLEEVLKVLSFKYVSEN